MSPDSRLPASSRAILIGVSNYQDSVAYPSYPAVANSLRSMHAVLTDPDLCGWPKGAVVCIPNPHKAGKIIPQLRTMAKETTGVLLLYFVGHGVLTQDGELCLAITDTDDANPDATGLEYSKIKRMLYGGTPATVRIAILDCCYSGRVIGLAASTACRQLADLSAAAGTYTLTAADVFADVDSGRDKSAQTALTGELVALIRSGIPEGPPSLTLGDLYPHLWQRLARKNLPHPNQRGDNLVTQFVFTRNAAHLAEERAREKREQNARQKAEEQAQREREEHARQKVEEQVQREREEPAQRESHRVDVIEVEAIRSDVSQLEHAVASPLSWQRAGALHILEDLLGSRHPAYRDLAEDMLLKLTQDRDIGVARKAISLWHSHGLGEERLRLTPIERRLSVSQKTGLTLAAGIDFGTTNSAIACFVDDECQVALSASGARTMPSIASMRENGDWMVGEIAKPYIIMNPKRTFRAMKLLLGTNRTRVVDGHAYTPEEVCSVILRELRENAERHFGSPLTGVVLTVPANFDLAQRYALAEAANLAGLNVLRILTEPTAAALTYGLNKSIEERILVYDLGGGTFDVSVLEIGNNVAEVKATSGDNALGGEYWDEQVCRWLIDRFKTTSGVDLTDSAMIPRFREAAENAKIELSSQAATTIHIPYTAKDGSGNNLSLNERLTRTEFQRITSDLLDRTRAPLNQAIKDSGISISEIDHVVLVGGSTRMPAVTSLVRELTGKLPRRGIIPDGIVVGATIQAGVLVGLHNESLLLDAFPFSLGVEVNGGNIVNFVSRHTTIPTASRQVLTTSQDNQPSVEIWVYQGGMNEVRKDKCLGMLELTGLTSSPRGVPEIEVQFDIDANGVVSVSAKDLRTGKGRTMMVNRQTVEAVSAAARAQHNALPSLPGSYTPLTSRTY